MVKRIMTGTVRQAYKQVGAKPVRRTWGDGVTTCCPQMVLARKAGKGTNDYGAYCERVYGEAYAYGFRLGYDGYKPNVGKYGKERYMLGWQDGRRVARALGYKVCAYKRAA